MNYLLVGVIGLGVLVLAATGMRGAQPVLPPLPAGHPAPAPRPALVVSTLAGHPLPLDYADGQGAAARFRHVGPLATDRQGNVYVGDGGTVRKITPAGRVSTLAGEPPVQQVRVGGSIERISLSGDMADGRGSAARLGWPQALAVGPDGTVYMCANNTIRRISPDGQVSTWAAPQELNGPKHRDGPVAQALFNQPRGLAVDAAGNVYVADWEDHVIRKISAQGTVSTLAGAVGKYGAVDGVGPEARFHRPRALALAPDGALLVADFHNHCIRRVGMDGTVTTWVGTLPKTEPGTGPGAGVKLDAIVSLVVDRHGTIYFTDISHTHTVRRILPDRTEPVKPWAGQEKTRAHADAPTPAEARFRYAEALALGPDGTLYVADELTGVVRAIAPTGQATTLAGQLPRTAFDGPAAGAAFDRPKGLALDPTGNVLVADLGNSRLRCITPAGDVRTVTGRVTPPGEQRQPPEELDGPAGVAPGPGGAVFVADEIRHTVYRVSPAGEVRVWAGRPGDGPGDRDDGWLSRAKQARFNYPSTIAAAPDGTLYVTDRDSRAVRRISPQGRVSTFLKGKSLHLRGSAFSNEGRTYSPPLAVAVGPDGSVYVLKGTLRKYPKSGGRSVLLAGDEEAGYADGQGAQARFHYPTGLAVDAQGNVFIADRGNHLIRRVSPQGEVTTVAGQVGRLVFEKSPNPSCVHYYYGSDDTGRAGAVARGDYRDGPADQARFNHPTGVAVGPDGTLYVADQDNDCIRVIRPAAPKGP